MIKKAWFTLISFLYFLKHLYESKYIIGQLTKRDFKNKYLGSYLGLPWAFIQPLAMIGVMWFAFTYGLRMGTVDGETPFAFWLVVGIIPWFYMQEIITSSSNSIQEYAYLIKNVNFKASIIPLVKLLAASMIHGFFIIFIMLVCIAYGIYPNLSWLQVLYYLFCIVYLTIGIAWLTSSFYVFIKDIAQIVGVLMTLFFWLTPIIWSIQIVPDHLIKYLKLNPFFYIVEGYRNTFIYNIWFFDDIKHTLYFWIISSFFFFVGAVTFHRLKPHFADVL